MDYTKFALFFNHTEPHWLAEVAGGVQWALDPDGPHPDHPTDAHWCDPASASIIWKSCRKVFRSMCTKADYSAVYIDP